MGYNYKKVFHLVHVEGGESMHCSLFERLTENEKRQVFSNLSKPVNIPKEGELYKKGFIGILISGNAVILRCSDVGVTVNMRTIGTGGIFGSASVFGDWDYHLSSIRAKSDCSVIYITESDFKALLEKYPAMAISYIEFLTERIRFLNHRFDTFSADSTDHRLYEYLISAADENGVVEFDYGMSELARRLKIGRSSLYRSIEALEKSDFVKREGKRFLLKT